MTTPTGPSNENFPEHTTAFYQAATGFILNKGRSANTTLLSYGSIQDDTQAAQSFTHVPMQVTEEETVSKNANKSANKSPAQNKRKPSNEHDDTIGNTPVKKMRKTPQRGRHAKGTNQTEGRGSVRIMSSHSTSAQSQ